MNLTHLHATFATHYHSKRHSTQDLRRYFQYVLSLAREFVSRSSFDLSFTDNDVQPEIQFFSHS